MMSEYLVSARKYRPNKFENVVGQDHVTQTLANAISKNQIAHSYLFCGPRGVGKTTCARIFAELVNGDNDPCVDQTWSTLELQPNITLDIDMEY